MLSGHCFGMIQNIPGQSLPAGPGESPERRRQIDPAEIGFGHLPERHGLFGQMQGQLRHEPNRLEHGIVFDKSRMVTHEQRSEADLVFIGRIGTPWLQRGDCPRQGALDGPVCEIVVDERWAEALTGIDRHGHLQILYWMHQARRDLVLLSPKGHGRPSGPFALRAPTRPNPIASSVVALLERRENVLCVRGLDCLDGTPLLDIKPWRGAL